MFLLNAPIYTQQVFICSKSTMEALEQDLQSVKGLQKRHQNNLIDMKALRNIDFALVSIVKACVCYFLSNFYFFPNDSPSKTMKNVFYLTKKPFSRYSDFCISVFPSFSPCQPLL